MEAAGGCVKGVGAVPGVAPFPGGPLPGWMWFAVGEWGWGDRRPFQGPTIGGGVGFVPGLTPRAGFDVPVGDRYEAGHGRMAMRPPIRKNDAVTQ